MIFIANAFMLGVAGFFWERHGVLNKLIVFTLIALAAVNAAAASAIITSFMGRP